jgi:hypothetical protein
MTGPEHSIGAHGLMMRLHTSHDFAFTTHGLAHSDADARAELAEVPPLNLLLSEDLHDLGPRR